MNFSMDMHPYQSTRPSCSDREQLTKEFADYHATFVNQIKFSNVPNERKTIITQLLQESVAITMGSTVKNRLSNGNLKGSYLAAFAKSLEELLTEGGDDRLLIPWNDLHPVNKYFSSTLPNDDLVRRSSCTCTSINTIEYLAAEEIRLSALEALLMDNADEWLDQRNASIREQLSAVFGFPSGPLQPSIILCPSGTDAEYLPLCVAQVLIAKYPGGQGRVVNIISAAGEVGSGTELAATGKFFSNVLPSGESSCKGKTLAHIEKVLIEGLSFTPRCPITGNSCCEDDIIAQEVRRRMQETGTLVILHVVVGSKTGLIQPTPELADELRREFGDRLIIVVDACQLRNNLADIAKFVSKGYIVLTTGSKFFCGPPFCGAAIIPHQYSALMETYGTLPDGIKSFMTKHDFPSSMAKLRSYLAAREGEGWSNLGLTLRWGIAADNMARYCQIEENDVRDFSAYWTESIEALTKRFEPYIQVFKAKSECDEGTSIRGIVSISIFVNEDFEGEVRPIKMEEAKQFHRLMVEGAAPFALLGQPVAVADESRTSVVSNVLRYALGADMVLHVLSQQTGRAMESHRRMAELLRVDEEVFSKLASIARGWRPVAFPGWSTESSKNIARMQSLDSALLIDSTALRCDAAKALSASRAAQVLRQCAGSGEHNVSILFDIDAFWSSCQALITEFGCAYNIMHCFAVKSCPVSYVLHLALKCGLGLETASIGEVVHALRLGCQPSKIVFDSPCKTSKEIEFALRNCVQVNANSLVEFAKIKKVIETLRCKSCGGNSSLDLGKVGLRVNPLVGEGDIAALSTATFSSKFGVPLTAETRPNIIALFKDNEFLVGLMSHVGSQGMSLEHLAQGAVAVTLLAEEIDLCCGSQRVSFIDIGGGLSVNYSSDSTFPSFEAYKDAIVRLLPSFFCLNKHRNIITEFGKSLVAKCAVVVALVEDVLLVPSQDPCDTGKELVAVVHAGADLFLRTAYCPDKFAHRVEIIDSLKKIVIGREISTVTISGPLCFSGDVIVKKSLMPEVQCGDSVVVLDAGANTLSLYSKHCSRTSPQVLGFRSIKKEGLKNGRCVMESFSVVCLRDDETLDSVLAFWG